MARSKSKKRKRNKKMRERLNESSLEMSARLAKSRGGRGTIVIKDKKKYSRRKKHKNMEE